ncbi:MAG: hypothetical protein L3J52_10640 [Proteobacteria bacterium]|nr:hypothetical protein [Pseudomonadota bacterium]
MYHSDRTELEFHQTNPYNHPMSKDQQTNLTQQNQQAIYCQQIITYLTVLNWFKAIQTLQKAATYNKKFVSGTKKITPEPNQQNPGFKSLKYQGKPENNRLFTAFMSIKTINVFVTP